MGRVLANRFLTEAGSCQEVFNPVGEPVRGRGGCIARPLRGFPEFAYRMGRARNSRCRPVGSRAQTAGPVFPHSVRKLRRAQADPPPPHRPTHLISTPIGTRLMTATGSICRGVPVRRDAPVDPDLSENTDRSVPPGQTTQHSTPHRIAQKNHRFNHTLQTGPGGCGAGRVCLNTPATAG